MIMNLLVAAAAAATTPTADIVATDAYTWRGDSIIQGEYRAWAVSPTEIISTYHARPHYFMPVEGQWKLQNDISAYPRLTTPNRLHTALYNMALDEMVNAVEPDTTLRTGKEWAGVWTRDVSYSIILSMAALQPEASMISLMRKVNAEGQIIQDTGSGGAWPISTDRMVWVLAAWEVYKVTGDRRWLETVYPIAVRSLAKDAATVISPDGLVKGETSFIDWREQSYPKWMQTADIAQSEAMGTNVVHAAALQAVSDMAAALGHKKEASEYSQQSQRLAEAIEKNFATNQGYWGMYRYGRDSMVLNPRAESLGLALAILYGVASPERQRAISETAPITPWGPPVFWPQIADMPSYHNNALWPFVASYWTLAQAKAGNEQAVMEGIGSVMRPAALFATNKENLNLDNGDIYTELNSSNMLWSLSGNIALTQRLLFGLQFEPDGLRIAPFVPQALGGVRSLDNFPYRGGRIDITVEGYGSRVARLTLDGKEVAPDAVIPAARLKNGTKITAVMDNRPIAPMQLNRVANLKAPLTPIAWLEHNPDLDAAGVPRANQLVWNPIEYIAGYVVLRDGLEAGRTRQTTFPATEPGEWQVIGLAADGTPGFASEPRSNRPRLTVEMPLEGTSLASPELSYAPANPVKGWNGRGFAETDQKSGPIAVQVEIPSAGTWTVALRYANGNGPVNTENKAAVRTLSVDGHKAGTLVMPTRGVANWDDWGLTNTVRLDLTQGTHLLTIDYLPEDSNMNLDTNHALIDRLVLEQAK